MAKPGRKSKYNDCAPLIVQGIAEGNTYARSCKAAGVSIESFCEWKRRYPQFVEAIKKAENEFRQRILGELEASLWKRAMGYDFEEVRMEMGADKHGNPVPVKQVKIKKHIPSDTGALIFALTNVAPDKWKNKQSSELTGRDGKDLMPEPLTIEVIDSRDKVEDEGSAKVGFKYEGKDEAASD